MNVCHFAFWLEQLAVLDNGATTIFAAVQFTTHAGPRQLLLSTAEDGGSSLEVVEISPNDFFWGRGVDGSGENHLGRLLMELRHSLLHSSRAQLAASQTSPSQSHHLHPGGPLQAGRQ